jgi:hypothetical protein
MEFSLTIIQAAFVLAMCMQAISAIFSEGMIFSVPGAWLERNAHFVWKMLMGCPVCMCPWYGTGVVLALGLTPWTFISIVTAMGINWVISGFMPEENAPTPEENEPIRNTTGL